MSDISQAARARDIVKLAEHASIAITMGGGTMGMPWVVLDDDSKNYPDFDPFTSLDDAWLFAEALDAQGYRADLGAGKEVLCEAICRAYAAAHGIELET